MGLLTDMPQIKEKIHLLKLVIGGNNYDKCKKVLIFLKSINNNKKQNKTHNSELSGNMKGNKTLIIWKWEI